MIKISNDTGAVYLETKRDLAAMVAEYNSYTVPKAVIAAGLEPPTDSVQQFLDFYNIGLDDILGEWHVLINGRFYTELAWIGCEDGVSLEERQREMGDTVVIDTYETEQEYWDAVSTYKVEAERLFGAYLKELEG